MKKIANQILYNLKKEKTSFISFGVIILITALILNCAAVLLCQVDRAYDTKFEKLSTAMLNAIVPEVQNSVNLKKAIDEIEKVEKIESYTAIMTEATVKDFNGADFSMNTVFYNIDDKRSYSMISDEITQHKEIGLIFVAVFFFIAMLITITTVHRLLNSQRMQIGILKSLGFRKRKLYIHYISHSTFVCAVGSLIGWCIGYIILPKILYPVMEEIYTLPKLSPSM